MVSTIDKDMFKNIWTDGIITFDTCSMGRMYEWEYESAINIKDALSYLFASGHLWETEYNCEEFKVQREEIKKSIFQQKYENGIFKQLKKRPIPWEKINKTFRRWEGKGYNLLFIDELDKLRSKKHMFDDEIERLRVLAKSLPAHPDADDLFDDILSKSDISLSDQEKRKLIDKYNSGVVCPGSCDKGKNNGKQYNDLFIWEILKKKAVQADMDIIFITSDTKTDWFVDGSPRAEYINEFQRETGRDIMIFTLVDFWECCRIYLDLPIDDFILQSTIRTQLEEKYDDCYEEDILEKVEELIFESNEITFLLEDSVDCCVDMAVIDQINQCTIDDIYPLLYLSDDEYVAVTVEMTVDITFNAQNQTAGEDWSPGSGSFLFNISAMASIPVKWSSDDTKRVVLEDSITVDEIVDVTVVPTTPSYKEDDYDDAIDFMDGEEDYPEDGDKDFGF
jgi:hypothetical protein